MTSNHNKSVRATDNPGSNCEGCSTITDRLSMRGYCAKCQRDPQAKVTKRKKQEVRESMREAGVL